MTSKPPGVRVVDAGSADPGFAGVRPIPIDANQIDICKPPDRDSPVYGRVAPFVSKIRDTLIQRREDTSAQTASFVRAQPRPRALS
jgi:hypothetical protein